MRYNPTIFMGKGFKVHATIVFACGRIDRFVMGCNG